MSIIFVILYWLTIFRIIHKLFFFVREDVLIKLIWIMKRKTPLIIPCHAPGVMPLPLWQGRVLRGWVLRGPTFTGSSCLQGRVLRIPLLRYGAKSEAGTKNMPISRSLMCLQWIFIAYNTINCFPITISNTSLASAIVTVVSAKSSSPASGSVWIWSSWYGKSSPGVCELQLI